MQYTAMAKASNGAINQVGSDVVGEGGKAKERDIECMSAGDHSLQILTRVADRPSHDGTPLLWPPGC
jgi:hypothetical protein